MHVYAIKLNHSVSVVVFFSFCALESKHIAKEEAGFDGIGKDIL